MKLAWLHKHHTVPLTHCVYTHDNYAYNLTYMVYVRNLSNYYYSNDDKSSTTDDLLS